MPYPPPVFLKAENIARSFGARRIFGPLSFQVEAGTVFGIAGRNGAGKTTLIKTLAGLIRPSSGKVLVASSREPGAPMLAPRDTPLALGWAAPDLALYGELTPAENLAFFTKVRGEDDSPARIAAMIDRVGLDPKRLAAVETRFLSTGMRQRLKLAFATLSQPTVLFLDEPSSNLDEAGRAIVAKVVAEQRRGGAVLIASNDTRDLALADRVVTL
jgi:ABC-type multidrug transport system ATPase subunit